MPLTTRSLGHSKDTWKEKQPRVLLLGFYFLLLFSLSGFVALINPSSQALQIRDELADYPWIFLRDGEIPTEVDLVTLIAVGDIMLGRGIRGKERVFDRVAPWLSRADLTMGNFEGVISSHVGSAQIKLADPMQSPYQLIALPTSSAWLQRAGFDVLGLANNHAMDQGEEGLKETVERLQRVGISILGVNPTGSGAYQPLYREIKGVEIAFLAFNAVLNPAERNAREQVSGGFNLSNWDDEKILEAIRVAHSHADAVIVSVHWGYEYDIYPSQWQQEIARIMVEAGADLVLGHHPHVIQKTQVFENSQAGPTNRISLVAYSLGNFVFDQYGERTSQGLALRAFLDKNGLLAVQALPVWTVPRPRLMSRNEMERIIEMVQPAAKRVGFACDCKGCVEVDIPQEAQEGIFREGQIDLTGDGRPEMVVRYTAEKPMNQDRQLSQVGGGVRIIQDGVLVWESKSEWQVLDLALGDPNDDGRYEIMLALQKPDSEGVMTSHPFIIGYRGGSYKDVWGGSAVAYPIRELELGDLDGDGIQELVVLEEQGDRYRQAVTVWRWNGWGFNLEWRSPESRYRDLVLLPDKNGVSIISVGEIW